jgi:exosortase
MSPGGQIRGRAALVAATVATVAAAGLLFAPTLQWLLRTWRIHPYYSHGALLVPIAAWLVWRERRRFTAADRPAVREVGAGFALAVTASAAAVAALGSDTHAVAAMLLLVTMLGVVTVLGGRNALRAAAFPVGLLALGIPLPLAERLGPGLAADVAALTASAAGAVGVAVVRAGAELTVGDGSFTVGAPCSGLRSMIALVTLAYLAAGLLPGPLPRRALLVAAAVPLALAANAARLFGLLVVTNVRGAEAGLAVFEGPASPVLFALAVGGLLTLTAPLGLKR